MMAYDRRKPRLWRMARTLRWLSILSLILVIMFLASVIYSLFVFGTQASIQVPSNGPLALGSPSGGGFQATVQVNVSNPSMYTLQLDLAAVLVQDHGPRWGAGDSGVVDVAPGNHPTPLSMTFTVPGSLIQANSGALLTHNATLVGALWLNGSYATVFTFGAHLGANTTWGAPFHGLTVTPGTPTASGGTTTVPVAFNFTNYAFFPDVGTISVQVLHGGSPCGSPTSVLLNAPAHQAYSSQTNITGPSSCMAPGDTVETTYSMGSLTVNFPTETVP